MAEASTPGALEGIRIIEIASGGAVAYAGLLFAQSGAEVIRIEPPGGDAIRRAGPFPGDQFGLDGGGLHRLLNGGKRSVALDVTSEANWQEAIAATVECFGKLDILVNNAGILPEFNPIDETPMKDWNRVMDVNATGVFLGMKVAIPEMHKAGGGSIINISSGSGLVGQATIQAGYNASKGAVRLLTKSGAIQYAKEGIRVNSVHPGAIATPMTEAMFSDPEWDKFRRLIPLGRYAEPEEVAYGVLHLASDDSSYVTGSELVIDGGSTAQ